MSIIIGPMTSREGHRWGIRRDFTQGKRGERRLYCRNPDCKAVRYHCRMTNQVLGFSSMKEALFGMYPLYPLEPPCPLEE